MVSPERKSDILNKLINEGRIKDIYLLARFMYKVAEPIMDDSTYDEFEKGLKDSEYKILTEKSYDDDPVPKELLDEFGLGHLAIENDSKNEYCKYLDADKSMSIEALYDYEEAFKFFKAHRNVRLIASVKNNGINTKSLWLDGEYKATMTRGRATNAMDVTQNAYRKLGSIRVPSEGNKTLYAECLVDDDKFRELPKQEGSFTASRMAAISMLRTNYDDEWYKYLKFYFFGAEGLKPTIHETLDYLDECGLNTVPRLLIEPNEFPEEFEDFCIWLKSKIFDPLYKNQVEGKIPADGVVIDVDDYSYVGEVTNQYSSRNCALKFEYWSSAVYKGVVDKVLIEQQEVDASCVVLIKPLLTEDGATCRRVSCYNPSILIENGIKPGSDIYFVRNSEAISVIVYGAELDRLRGRKTKLSEKLSNFS